MRHPYISGPMTNIEYHNFPLFFECEDALERLGYYPLNPARLTPTCTWESAYQDIQDSPETWESCIRRDIQDVINSDSIVLLQNWGLSRGACLELVLAVSIGNPVLVWFPGSDPYPIADPSIHYDTALNYLKKSGIISPVDMYNTNRPVLY